VFGFIWIAYTEDTEKEEKLIQFTLLGWSLPQTTVAQAGENFPFGVRKQGALLLASSPSCSRSAPFIYIPGNSRLPLYEGPATLLPQSLLNPGDRKRGGSVSFRNGSVRS
jgi:hypothetical protein